MGFFEDDRVRAKNIIHNEAWNLYHSFKALNFDDSTIKDHVNLALQHTSDSYRNNIYDAILRIIGRSNEVSATDIDSSSNTSDK